MDLYGTLTLDTHICLDGPGLTLHSRWATDPQHGQRPGGHRVRLRRRRLRQRSWEQLEVGLRLTGAATRGSSQTTGPGSEVQVFGEGPQEAQGRGTDDGKGKDK